MFRAYDAQRERLVAVKLFNLDLPPEKGHQLVAAFERLIAAELTHPALAAPLATGLTGVSAFLAQDYVAAESLDLAVREYGPAPPSDALRVAAQLAGALDFAAVANISHGALHPRDVLLSSDDTRLTGIGVARALEQVGVTAPVRRPYTPPERIAGAAWDRRADVFSLAALIHELLWARRVSGTGAHAADSLTEIEGGDLGRLRAAFARALAEDPLERFDTALEFAESLKDAFPAVTLTPPETRPSPTASRQSKKARLTTDDSRLTTDDSRPTTEVEPRLPLDLPEPGPAAPIGAASSSFDLDEVFRTEPQTPDLNLQAVDDARYADVEVAPPMVKTEVPHAELREVAPAALNTAYEPEPLSALERSRSAVWPLVLALMVGIAMGFAAGYGIGSRERPAAGVASLTPPAEGREFTEGAVTEPPKPANGEVRVKPDATGGPGATATSPGATPTAPAATAAPTPTTAGRGVRLQPGNPPAGRGVRLQPDNPPVSAVPNDGRLLVRSTPTGARVFVDGRESGRTPAALRDLARGSHRVRVTEDGYVTAERRVVITRSRPAQSITVALTTARGPGARGTQAVAPAPATPGTVGPLAGVLRVESRPPGASVYLDGKLVGTTPVSLPVVPAGEHAIRLERDGYRRWSSSVRIVASEQNKVTASLER